MTYALFATAFARPRRARPAAPPRLDRFAPDIRPAVARLAALDPRLRDLAASFPALLRRLALLPDTDRSRQAIKLVRAGGSLKTAAFAAGLPFWTRKLPPEAFGAVAPELPGGFWFSRRIVNVLPTSPRTAPAWLAAVSEAARWGEEGAALWAARICASPGGLTPEEARLVALHDWFARRPRTRAGMFADRVWLARRDREAALAGARDWLTSVGAFLVLGDRPVDPWLEDGEHDGFHFVAVTTSEALCVEAKAMSNCLRSYCHELARDCEQVFSVRKNGERLASLAVNFLDEAPFPQLSELKGPKNVAAPPEVWFAARRWLSEAPRRRVPKPCTAPVIGRAEWNVIWRPWWVAHRCFPPELPLAPLEDALQALYGYRPYRRRRRRRPRT